MTFKRPEHDLSPLDCLPVIAADSAPDVAEEQSQRTKTSGGAKREAPGTSQGRGDSESASNSSAASSRLPTTNQQSRPAAQPAPDLTEHERRLLIALVRHPNQRAGKYPKIARMNAHRTVKARQSLIRLGLSREYELATSPRGRPARIVALTPLGESIGQSIIPIGDS